MYSTQQKTHVSFRGVSGSGTRASFLAVFSTSGDEAAEDPVGELHNREQLVYRHVQHISTHSPACGPRVYPVDDVEDGLAVDGEERDGREVFRLELGKELPLNQV